MKNVFIIWAELKVRGRGGGTSKGITNKAMTYKINVVFIDEAGLCVFQSLPEEERDRVMTEEKLGGARLGGGAASSPHRAKSPSIKV